MIKMGGVGTPNCKLGWGIVWVVDLAWFEVGWLSTCSFFVLVLFTSCGDFAPPGTLSLKLGKEWKG